MYKSNQIGIKKGDKSWNLSELIMNKWLWIILIVDLNTRKI